MTWTHAANDRRRSTRWCSRLVGRRYVLAWGLCLTGGGLHLALAGGGEVAWQVWAMGLVGITAGLLGLWWIEPYVLYRYRRRRFRGVLAAEGGWTAWALHRPARPWAPMRMRLLGPVLPIRRRRPARRPVAAEPIGPAPTHG